MTIVDQAFEFIGIVVSLVVGVCCLAVVLGVIRSHFYPGED